MKKAILTTTKILFAIHFIFTSILCGLVVRSYFYNKPVGRKSSDKEVLQFPEDFLWGTATASYQVEGGNVHSNWWKFEQIKGNIKNGDRTKVGINHYEMYKKDIELMSQLNMDSYRFSIEWSRIEPQMGEFDHDEIEHYREVLNTLEKYDIKPMVTLWHHSLPAWFEDAGGWEKEENIEYYLEYVSFVAGELGEEVELWLTMNEPMAYIATGYISAKWPPKEKSYEKVPILFKNITTAHEKAYDLIHKLDCEAQVGLTEHASYVVPADGWNPIESTAAMGIDYIWTHHLLKKVQSSLDYIGVHYYYKQTIRLSLAYEVLTKDPQDFENQSLDRAYYPQGLYETLVKFKQYKIPIYITEIGVPDYHHIDRDQFIREHAREVYYAIRDGVDVRGFYYWTLLDCFEWTEGYAAEFGLIEVNMDTLERSIKDESWEYGEMAGCNCVAN